MHIIRYASSVIPVWCLVQHIFAMRVGSLLLGSSFSTKLYLHSFIHEHYRAAACDVICLEAIVRPGGKTMERLYSNGRKFASFLLTSPALIIEHLQY